MHARVVNVQIKPDKWDDTQSLYWSLEALWNQQNGFRGAYLLGDRSSGKGISVTLWDTQADIEATESSGWYQEQLTKFEAYFASPPDMAHYEVTVEVRPAVVGP